MQARSGDPSHRVRRGLLSHALDRVSCHKHRRGEASCAVSRYQLKRATAPFAFRLSSPREAKAFLSPRSQALDRQALAFCFFHASNQSGFSESGTLLDSLKAFFDP
jgi:hypothetical protein